MPKFIRLFFFLGLIGLGFYFLAVKSSDEVEPTSHKDRSAWHFARQRWLIQPFVIPLKANPKSVADRRLKKLIIRNSHQELLLNFG